MEENGIPQWDEVYPSREDLQEDIRQGTYSLRLDAFSENPFALKLYRSLGYRETGTAVFRKGKFYLFEKNLDKNLDQNLD